MKLRDYYVPLRCERCERKLDWYFHTGELGASTPPNHLRRRFSNGPNGLRVAYRCKCGAAPVLLLAKLLPLVPAAYRDGVSIYTNYLRM